MAHDPGPEPDQVRLELLEAEESTRLVFTNAPTLIAKAADTLDR